MADAPPRMPPDSGWGHHRLFERVREAVFAVPGNFRSDVVIRGVQVTDLFNLNALLGAAIEAGVVSTLNSLRPLWDGEERYAMYSFVRQPQTFPDVRLQNSADPSDILLGIELKGWYLLAKEKEPSFRFLATPAACAAADLFVVYPWHLSEVISGVPRLAEPYVELARYVAEYRNHHWEHLMSHQKSPRIIPAKAGHPYPSKTDEILDKAEADGGRNFGRIARTGLLDRFCEAAGDRLLAGIPARYWRRFFKTFTETATEQTIEAMLNRFAEDVRGTWEANEGDLDEVMRIVRQLIGRLK